MFNGACSFLICEKPQITKRSFFFGCIDQEAHLMMLVNNYCGMLLILAGAVKRKKGFDKYKANLIS